MALPVRNAAENEDELVHGFDTTGYSQLPADHLSDSSERSNGSSCNLAESSNGTSCNLAYDTLGTSVASLQMENLATTHNMPHDAYIAHITEIQAAATHDEAVVAYMNAGSPYQNGGHVAHIDRAAADAAAHRSSYQNDNHVAHIDGMENQGIASNRNTLYGNGGHVVHIDGMEIHVYGQLAGLQLLSPTHNLGNHDDQEVVDVEDDVDDSEKQHTEDLAFQRAKEADDAHRLAPLPADRCQAIKNAMQSISLGGFRPEWADRVPEEQWVNRLRRKPLSKSIEN